MPARLPDFLGLGTQKGGTTSLHQLLNKHPEIYVPSCKEVHYFDLNNHQSLDWYKKHFADANKKQKCGEITPFYLFHPKTPKRIKKVIPKVKMIILLRDPVERALSQLFHARKRGFEQLSPEEALAAEEIRIASGSLYSLQKHSYVSRSRYLEQLDRYESIFTKKQLLILKSEDLYNQPKEAWQKIEEYLQIKGYELSNSIPTANQGEKQSKPLLEKLRCQLRGQLKETAKGVRQRYGFGWDWEKQ